MWVLGVLGGSGVYDIPGLADVREQRIDAGEPEPVAQELELLPLCVQRADQQDRAVGVHR